MNDFPDTLSVYMLGKGGSSLETGMSATTLIAMALGLLSGLLRLQSPMAEQLTAMDALTLAVNRFVLRVHCVPFSVL